MLRVLDSEYGRLAHLVVDRVRQYTGSATGRRGAAQDGVRGGLERDRDHGGEQRRDGGRDGTKPQCDTTPQHTRCRVDRRDDQPRGDDRPRQTSDEREQCSRAMSTRAATAPGGPGSSTCVISHPTQGQIPRRTAPSQSSSTRAASAAREVHVRDDAPGQERVEPPSDSSTNLRVVPLSKVPRQQHVLCGQRPPRPWLAPQSSSRLDNTNVRPSRSVRPPRRSTWSTLGASCNEIARRGPAAQRCSASGPHGRDDTVRRLCLTVIRMRGARLITRGGPKSITALAYCTTRMRPAGGKTTTAPRTRSPKPVRGDGSSTNPLLWRWAFLHPLPVSHSAFCESVGLGKHPGAPHQEHRQAARSTGSAAPQLSGQPSGQPQASGTRESISPSAGSEDQRAHASAAWRSCRRWFRT